MILLYNHQFSRVQPILFLLHQVVRLTFEEFVVETKCSYDCLKVYDGRNENSTLLGQFSGTDRPDDVVSTGRFLFLVFSSDSNVAKRGFVITFHAEAKVMPSTTPAPGKPFKILMPFFQYQCMQVFFAFISYGK